MKEHLLHYEICCLNVLTQRLQSKPGTDPWADPGGGPGGWSGGQDPPFLSNYNTYNCN